MVAHPIALDTESKSFTADQFLAASPSAEVTIANGAPTSFEVVTFFFGGNWFRIDGINANAEELSHWSDLALYGVLGVPSPTPG